MHLWLSPHDSRIRALGTQGAQGELDYGFAQTPFGGCLALMTGSHLLAFYFTEEREAGVAALRNKWPDTTLRPSAVVDDVITRVFEQPETLSAIPLMAIGTPFQLTVWEYLCGIPEGSTLTYGEVAKAIGRPTAARAVGQAVGANEISILIPCHRVVSQGKLRGKSGGKLGGYRWGVERKKSLLAWELSRKDPLVMPF